MEKTLVVMAAGLGSRFGGLKQATPVDEDENFIMDYSVYDAIRNGFTKVVFVIREEHLNLFKNSIGKRLENKIKVCYALQKMDEIPVSLDVSKREKPWGTVHALLCAKSYVDGSFVVVNADDFYGYNAFKEANFFLDNVTCTTEYACISYQYGVTKSMEGSVKRGVLEVNQNNEITSIIECSIETIGKEFIASPLNGEECFPISYETPVSMNLFAFQKSIFDFLDAYFLKFFTQNKEELLKSEALLPECLMENIKNKSITLYNCPSNSLWLGMTYRSDLDDVKEKLKELKSKQEYPLHLWE